MPEFLPWIVTVLTLYAAYKNAKGDLMFSFGLWFFCNLFWLYMDISREIYAQAFVYIAFLCTNLYGMYKIIQKEKEEDKHYEEFEY